MLYNLLGSQLIHQFQNLCILIMKAVVALAVFACVATVVAAGVYQRDDVYSAFCCILQCTPECTCCIV